MDDIEDVVEAFDDIEDIVEELLDPEDFLEELLEHTLTVVFALVAAAGVAFTLLMLFVAAVVGLLVDGGLTLLVGLLAGFGFLTTALAVGGFLYVRTDVPDRVQDKIDDARERARSRGDTDDRTEEERAIDHLQERYSEGEITDRELEAGLDAVMGSDDPMATARAVGEDGGHEREREREREYAD